MSRNGRINVNVHVGGRASVKVAMARSGKIRTFIALALMEAAIFDTVIPEWELRDIDGKSLDESWTLARADVVDGDNVYLSPRPGVGA